MASLISRPKPLRGTDRQDLRSTMPKPSNDLSDKQLHEGLAHGEFQGRDKLIAEEILRRRHEDRAAAGRYKLGWLGAVAAALWLWVKLRLRRPAS
jgi:hypothetical protein